MATEIKYNPVADGFHDTKIIFALRKDKSFGHDVSSHVIMELKLEPTDTDTENPAAYRADFPVLLVPGFEWGFYDEAQKKSVWRSATAADTKESVDNARKCFPAWAAYCETLPEGSEEEAFAWFTKPDLVKDVNVRAKLVRGTPYTGTDGFEHDDLKARVLPPYEAKPVMADGEAAQITKALKVAGVKLFGGGARKDAPKVETKPVATPAVAPTPAPATKPKAPAPKPVPPKKDIDKLREDAWTAYQESCADDPTGAHYYEKCAAIIGKDVLTWESWTADDWTKIISELAMPF